ncbi:MAG: N-acetylornithine carbamoyltransferase [Planctomycetota bacterium]|nr:N-acetylornithine carbamoyltransferase [Planctomycetota bacterium]
MTAGAAIPHFIRLEDLSDRQVEDILDLAARLKRGVSRAELAGRSVGLLFFRGSLRTRTSLVAAVQQLGGHTVNLTAASDFWELEARDGTVMDGAAPEHIRDAAVVMSKYVSALAIRPAAVTGSWEQERRDESIRAWAAHAEVPVINMESALWHPLQALADLLTLRETLGELEGKRLAITWTSSPTPSSPSVVHSALMAALRAGMNVSVAHPPGFGLDQGVLDEARSSAGERSLSFETGIGMDEATEGAHVVYARSWFSTETYNNPTLAATKVAAARGWTIDERIMARGADARLMHSMPVRRNLEVTDEVLDGPRSLLYAQAENRLHTQKGLLSLLLRG